MRHAHACMHMEKTQMSRATITPRCPLAADANVQGSRPPVPCTLYPAGRMCTWRSPSLVPCTLHPVPCRSDVHMALTLLGSFDAEAATTLRCTLAKRDATLYPVPCTLAKGDAAALAAAASSGKAPMGTAGAKPDSKVSRVLSK